VWSEVQVGAAGARVPTSRKPNVCSDKALKLAPQGAGAAKAEGDGAGPAAPPTTVPTTPSSSEHAVRRIQQ